MIKAGVVGGAGYVASELISLLVRHPEVKLVSVTSNSQKGLSVQEFHDDPAIATDLNFSETIDQEVDVLFLCGGHGFSKVYLSENNISDEVVVIDLSTDFRVDPSFVYGLPEINADKLTNRIANPGCFATAIQLALLPALKHIKGAVHVNAITGSTGAGQSFSSTSHFSWRHDNVSTYKLLDHQHLTEIHDTFSKQGNPVDELNFVPVRGPFTRGIFATIYCDCNLKQEEVTTLYQKFYESSAFTKVATESIDLKQVLNTNFCFVYPEVIKGKLVITSAIDNLLKGASGQAVQNLNCRFGFAQDLGLKLKPSRF